MNATNKVDFKKLLSKYSIILILIIIMVICTFANSSFLSASNLINVCRQQSVTIIIAFGEMALIICGQLDLSCGAVIALAGCLSVSSYKITGNMLLAFLVAVVIAVGVNLLNGIMVTKFMAPAFIATLATQTIDVYKRQLLIKQTRPLMRTSRIIKVSCSAPWVLSRLSSGTF